MRINIAIAGGPCTGKSTLAAALFSQLKERGFDYDLISEEHRKLSKEFGQCRSPFDRFYIWRQQEREELRSAAKDGFITDMPLFQLYIKARLYANEPRDRLAIRELFRMCLEIEDRYQIIVVAENPLEIPYRRDYTRTAGKEKAVRVHNLARSFVEHFYPDRVIFVKGNVTIRVKKVIKAIEELHKK